MFRMCSGGVDDGDFGGNSAIINCNCLSDVHKSEKHEFVCALQT